MVDADWVDCRRVVVSGFYVQKRGIYDRGMWRAFFRIAWRCPCIAWLYNTNKVLSDVEGAIYG